MRLSIRFQNPNSSKLLQDNVWSGILISEEHDRNLALIYDYILNILSFAEYKRWSEGPTLSGLKRQFKKLFICKPNHTLAVPTDWPIVKHPLNCSNTIVGIISGGHETGEGGDKNCNCHLYITICFAVCPSGKRRGPERPRRPSKI